MKWDLEERIEDAIVAYLKTKVAGAMRVFPALSDETMQFPCAIVHASQSGPVSEPASWHDARMFSVAVAVATESAPEKDVAGNTVRTSRERNAAARSEVMDALCITGLVAELNACIQSDLAISMAQMTTTERTQEAEQRKFVTVINLEVIAEPVRLTTA